MTKDKINPKPKELDLYLPRAARIVAVKQFTEKEKFFRLELMDGKKLGHSPGQFVQLSILGYGEAPISISSPPSANATFEICVRIVGNVTGKLHTMTEGDVIYIRGPFGHGFDQEIMERMKGKHLIFHAGGIGYVPLRSLINKVIPERKNYKKISVLYGFRSPSERLFAAELADIYKIGDNVEIYETVDSCDGDWHGCVGVITTLIPKVSFDPKDSMAVIVGPPVMYKFVLASLKERNLPDENIYVSLERHMKCGVGKCGHCQMADSYVCQEGPVYNYAEIKANVEAF